MDFIKIFGALISSIYYLIFSPFLGESLNTQSVIPMPTEAIKMFHASGTYSNSGITSSISIRFPENGGQVIGEFSGACKGGFSGTYNQDTVKGSGNGICKILLFTLDSTIEAIGKVDKENKQIDMDFTGKAGEFNHSGTVHLVID